MLLPVKIMTVYFAFVFRLISGCWRKVINVEGLSNYFTNYNNFGECKLACENDIDCVALDWWIKSSYCIMQFNNATIQFPWNGYVTHYNLNRSCVLRK